MIKTLLVSSALFTSLAAYAGNPILDNLRKEMERNTNAQRIAPINSPAPAPEPKAVTKATSDTSITSAVFNLKGLNLKMSHDDLDKIIPTANYVIEKTIDDKEVGLYKCGLQLRQFPGKKPVKCNFTLGGVEIRNMTVRFWGDRVVEIVMYFNDYSTDAYLDSNQANLIRLQDALDLKYPNEADGDPKLGSRDPGDGFWTANNELLDFDRSKIDQSKMDILVLKNPALEKYMMESYWKAEDKKKAQDRLNSANKSAADM